MKTVILCGGSGTRLWPISRKSTPKQFSKIFDGESLFEKTINRNQKHSTSYLIVVNKLQLPKCESQITPELKNNTDILIEPSARNTAPAIALAAFHSDPKDILLVLPSDHLIKDQNDYNNCVAKASELAQKGNLVTFGIKPTYPETGFGYIESKGDDVLSFKEKPQFEVAQEYVKKDNYFWNSGMFCFQAKVFLEELKKYSPQIHETAFAAYNGKTTKDNMINVDTERMNKIPSDSIDYAVMEKSKKVKVVPSNFSWSDLGSFDSMYDVLEKDINGNSKTDNTCLFASKNNLIINQGKKIIATFDIDDLIIVNTDDAILIGKKGQSQDVKKVLPLISDIKPELLD